MRPEVVAKAFERDSILRSSRPGDRRLDRGQIEDPQLIERRPVAWLAPQPLPLCVPLDEGDPLLQRAEDLVAARRITRWRRLILDARAEPVVAARARARKDLASAVQLLSRFVLVELEGALGAADNSALLAALEGDPA